MVGSTCFHHTCESESYKFMCKPHYFLDVSHVMHCWVQVGGDNDHT